MLEVHIVQKWLSSNLYIFYAMFSPKKRRNDCRGIFRNKFVLWNVRHAERLNVVLIIISNHERSICTAVLFMRMSRTAADKTDRITAARAMLLLRLQPL